MAFNLGSIFKRKAQQFVSDASGRALPGNDPLSKIGRNLLDSSANRLLTAGLKFGGENSDIFRDVAATVFRDGDIRVRLSMSPGSGNYLYKDPKNKLLEPLNDTDGVLFPYTPTVSVSHSAQYAGAHPTHSNYIQHSYNASSVDTINIDGYFTATNSDEARYVFAVLHFFRSAYKMFYGADQLRGTPPPVLRLSGYGPFNYNSVPVVITNFTEIMPADRDYIEVPLASSPDSATKTMIPSYMNMTISLLPIYSKNQIGNFSLDKFSKGALIGSPGKGGGFI